MFIDYIEFCLTVPIKPILKINTFSDHSYRSSFMANLTRVDGKNKGKIILYALSTCVWCKKTRSLLDELGVEYHYVYVDQLAADETKFTKEEMKKWNPQGSFPTIVINDAACIVGFDENRIMKEIGV